MNLSAEALQRYYQKMVVAAGLSVDEGNVEEAD
jgi:hypothetical protein